MVKKKSEEDESSIPELKEDEEQEEVLEDTEVLDEEQYEKYLLAEKERIDKEFEKLKSKKTEKDFLKDLPNKLNALEKAIEELQTAVKILWSQKKK